MSSSGSSSAVERQLPKLSRLAGVEPAGEIPSAARDLSDCAVSGSSSAVERQLPKLDVAGSIPVSRSIFIFFYRLTYLRTKVVRLRVDLSSHY
jgi:hypothetical protein